MQNVNYAYSYIDAVAGMYWCTGAYPSIKVRRALDRLFSLIRWLYVVRFIASERYNANRPIFTTHITVHICKDSSFFGQYSEFGILVLFLLLPIILLRIMWVCLEKRVLKLTFIDNKKEENASFRNYMKPDFAKLTVNQSECVTSINGQFYHGCPVA